MAALLGHLFALGRWFLVGLLAFLGAFFGFLLGTLDRLHREVRGHRFVGDEGDPVGAGLAFVVEDDASSTCRIEVRVAERDGGVGGFDPTPGRLLEPSGQLLPLLILEDLAEADAVWIEHGGRIVEGVVLGDVVEQEVEFADEIAGLGFLPLEDLAQALRDPGRDTCHLAKERLGIQGDNAPSRTPPAPSAAASRSAA